MRLSLLTLGCTAFLLLGCSPLPPQPSFAIRAEPPTAWHAPLPHGGSSGALVDWWQRFDDAELSQLIERAQAQNPSLAAVAARRRAAQAQAQQVQAGLLPQTSLQAGSTRSHGVNGNFATSQLSTAGLQARWELDLFGSQRAQAAAAQAQAQAAQSQWHEARVSLAADVAAAYLALRHAQAQEEVGFIDLRLAEDLARWGREQQRAGLISATDAALLNTERAGAAAGFSRQQAEAQVALQTLALLCGEPVAALAQQLAPPALPPGWALPARRLVAAPPFGVDVLPAAVLAQRPDVAAAHQQWLAAAHRVRAVEAQRLPQLSLGALLGGARLELGGSSLQGRAWSVAPSLSLPLFDGGLRAGQRDAAAAQLDEAAAQLQQRWQLALAEVEDALQRLQAEATRQREVDTAQQEWEAIARRSSHQAQAGLQSGVQRHTTYRNALAAYSAALGVRHAHAGAWVRLYRVLGGGWTSSS